MTFHRIIMCLCVSRDRNPPSGTRTEGGSKVPYCRQNFRHLVDECYYLLLNISLYAGLTLISITSSEIRPVSTLIAPACILSLNAPIMRCVVSLPQNRGSFSNCYVLMHMFWNSIKMIIDRSERQWIKHGTAYGITVLILLG